MMKLALGSAQFGLAYGVTNRMGKVPSSMVKELLQFACMQGITTLDTAIAYGDSEKIIGESLASAHLTMDVVSKLPALTSGALSVASLVQTSLRHLQQQKMYAMLFHSANDLLGNEGEQHYLDVSAYKDKGVIEKIGVSVYTPDDAFKIIERFNIDLIQLPLNLFDQRFITSGCIDALKSRGIEIHARSLFLQGTLLEPWYNLPKHFHVHVHYWQKLESVTKAYQLTPLSLCLSLINSVKEVDKFIIGCCHLTQLQEILALYPPPHLQIEIAQLAVEDEALIMPSMWP